jgi:rhamnogalacturonyl hydrolase YesR
MHINQAYLKLLTYVETEQYKGWDPYDGLSSKVFQATPLRHWDFARLAWIQLFKRNPINLRKILLIPKEHNPKGIGLIVQVYCNEWLAAKTRGDRAQQDYIYKKIIETAELLISLQSKGYSGACWGYNFDWQARRIFFFPKYTPTVVATSFGASALFNAYEITQKEKYLATALSSTRFILDDLSRTSYGGGTIFSYSPIPGNDQVFNASLLGAKTLSYAYQYTKQDELAENARLAVKAAVHAQNEEGSWIYGLHPVQTWIDSFHTGYNLEAIDAYQQATGDQSFEKAIKKGLDFYLEHFFEENGRPKYYHNKVYPIDIHCPAQLPVTLSRMQLFKEHELLVEKVLNWTVDNMQDPKGYFYYQLKPGLNSKIPYMRWSNAYMLYALSYYVKEKSLASSNA